MVDQNGFLQRKEGQARIDDRAQVQDASVAFGVGLVVSVACHECGPGYGGDEANELSEVAVRVCKAVRMMQSYGNAKY